MANSYGPMIGCNAAITWIENLQNVDNNIKERVLSRMRYEFDKDNPIPPKFHKGKHGKQYDNYTCGKCGTVLNHGVSSNFCFNCGYAIKWDNPRCLTGYNE